MTGVSSDGAATVGSSGIFVLFFREGLAEEGREGRDSGELTAPSLTDLDLSRVFWRNFGSLLVGLGEGVWRECLLFIIWIGKQVMVRQKRGRY
jgi:hypothetical protein